MSLPTKPVIVVSGLGRCGTTMLMHMLAAGGMDCVGEPASYEDDRARQQIDPGWFASLSGKAVKVLDPYRFGLPGGVAVRVIWLDRDPVEQMRSQVKILETLAGMQTTRVQRRSFVGKISIDRRAAMQALGGAPVLIQRFESLLLRPWSCAEVIATFVGAEFALDIDRMASVVQRRPPECAPDLAVELAYACAAEAREALSIQP